MVFACLIKTLEGFYWLADKDGEQWAVRGFTSKEQGLRYFESAYEAAHDRGYEASMSATINWIQFQPSIVGFERRTQMLPFYEGRPCTLSSVAGRLNVLTGKGKLQKLWDKGAKPKLVQDPKENRP